MHCTQGWRAKLKSGRYGHGKILLVQDKLLIQAESGEIVLVEASGQEHRELGRFAALSSKTWNYLALAGDILVVRSDREAQPIDCQRPSTIETHLKGFKPLAGGSNNGAQCVAAIPSAFRMTGSKKSLAS